MKKINFLQISALLFLYIFFYGCRKSNIENKISGQVFQYGSSIPIKGAEINLYKGENTGIFSNINFIEIDETVTENDGSFSFIYDKVDGFLYEVNASKELYYDSDNFSIGLKNEIDIFLDPYAWLKIHVKNDSPFDENDLLIAPTNPISGASPQSHVGINIDFEVTQRHRGNRENRILWAVTKNGLKVLYEDTIFLKAHDTVYFQLNY